jgi:hypothetical protein
VLMTISLTAFFHGLSCQPQDALIPREGKTSVTSILPG